MTSSDPAGPVRFRPTFWPTVMTVPMVLILIALGSWQVHRLYWKEALIAERTARLAAPAIDLPADPGPGADLEFRHARMTGHFLNDKEMLLAARSIHDELGFHVIVPFLRDGAGAVMVDRGFVPLDHKEAASRPQGQIEGPTQVAGIVRRQPVPGWFTPDNQPASGVWYWIDLPTMAKTAGLEAVAPVYLEADATANPGGLPIGGQTRWQLPNDHLQYAITWYALAVAAVVIYILYHRTPAKPERPEA
jgi:surfeit locus 1 family protein